MSITFRSTHKATCIAISYRRTADMPLLPPYDSRLHKEEAGMGRHKAQITPPKFLVSVSPYIVKGHTRLRKVNPHKLGLAFRSRVCFGTQYCSACFRQRICSGTNCVTSAKALRVTGKANENITARKPTRTYEVLTKNNLLRHSICYFLVTPHPLGRLESTDQSCSPPHSFRKYQRGKS